MREGTVSHKPREAHGSQGRAAGLTLERWIRSLAERAMCLEDGDARLGAGVLRLHVVKVGAIVLTLVVVLGHASQV